MSFGTLREPSIDALREAPVRFRYGANRRTVLVDALTASAVVTCYDALTRDDLKAKFARMVAGSPQQFRKIVNFCSNHLAHSQQAGPRRLAGLDNVKNRHLKISCPGCGYTARVTRKWLSVGLPICPCGVEMESEFDGEDIRQTNLKPSEKSDT